MNGNEKQAALQRQQLQRMKGLPHPGTSVAESSQPGNQRQTSGQAVCFSTSDMVYFCWIIFDLHTFGHGLQATLDGH